MRKYLVWIMALFLAVGYCLPAVAEADPFMKAVVAEPDEGDLALDDAVEIAKKAISEAAGEPFVSHFGMTARFITVNLKGEARRAWHIVLCNGVRYEDDCYAATVVSPSGEAVDVDRFQWYARREAWEAEKGPYPLWAAEDKALFYDLYTGTAGDAYGDGVPQAHDLTSGQAVQIAREALIAQKNADPEEMDSLMLSTWFQKKLAEGDGQTDYWCVLYLVPNSDSPSRYDAVYQANISSPDGEIYMLYNLHEDGLGNG